MRRLTAAILLGGLLTAAALGAPAQADDPAAALKRALDRTAQATSAKIALRQTATSGGRSHETTAGGALAGADSDLVVSGERGRTRRVAVGTTVHERELDQPGATWRRSERAAPERPTPFGALRLRDGTSAGDPKLYRSIAESTAPASSAAAPPGTAKSITAELDMAALATAMQLAPADRLRLERMAGMLTLHLAPDGSLLRNRLVLTIPGAAGAAGPTTLETEIDLSELDAPIAITPP